MIISELENYPPKGDNKLFTLCYYYRDPNNRGGWKNVSKLINNRGGQNNRGGWRN